MYKVTCRDDGESQEFESLTLALAWATKIGVYVTITGKDLEVVGMFGVDTIKDGVCPDGVAYDWNKASRIGKMKRAT